MLPSLSHLLFRTSGVLGWGGFLPHSLNLFVKPPSAALCSVEEVIQLRTLLHWGLSGTQAALLTAGFPGLSMGLVGSSSPVSTG